MVIPVEGLKLPRSLALGSVVLHPCAESRFLEMLPPPAGDGTGREMVESFVRDNSTATVAEVHGAEDLDDALDRVDVAMDVLVLFQQFHAIGQTTTFGLLPDAFRTRFGYLSVWDGDSGKTGSGWRFLGPDVGWTFGEEALLEFEASEEFGYLADVMQSGGVDEGSRRASRGARLLARAYREHRSDLKMLGVFAGLEALIGPSTSGPTTMQLVRNLTWFKCAIGPDRLSPPSTLGSCPYLWLDPMDKKGIKRLKALERLGTESGEWRCSDWHELQRWYRLRSEVAHGGPTPPDLAEEASKAEYAAIHYLLMPIVGWLRAHAADPVGDLVNAIETADRPSGWQAFEESLTRDPPPVVPTISCERPHR